MTSGALGACIAPFSAFQEKRIAELEELMEINEQIKEEVANLEAENKRLGTQVDDLETSVKRYIFQTDSFDILSLPEYSQKLPHYNLCYSV